MQSGVALGVLDGQGLPGFVGKNRFMFRPMILKDPTDLLEPGDDPDIGNEDKDLNEAV